LLPADRAVDVLCAVALFVGPLWIVGRGSHLLGIYSDDASFFDAFPDLSLATLADQLKAYVTGRNLHILWQYVIFAVTGHTLDALPAQHRFEAVMVGVNCVSCYALFRLCGLPSLPVFLGVALFAFLPNHPDVYFWLTAVPQHLISTFLVLLLAIGAVSAARAAPATPRRHIIMLLVANFLVFAAGLFTYDQTALVATAIAVAAAVVCFRRRTDLRVASAVYAGCCIALFIAWAAWKVAVPSFGPSLSNVTPLGLARNALLALSVTAGPHFVRTFADFVPTLFAVPSDAAAALSVALSFLFVGAVCLIASGAAESSPGDGCAFARRHPALLALALALFFIAAYAPALLWFISLRHTYLPSIAVAGAAAWSLWRIDVWLTRVHGTKAARLGAAALLAATCVVTFFFAAIVLAEKRDWILSFQARKQLYAELMQDEKFRAASTLILDEFPDAVRPMSAPLGYQMPGEPAVLTGGRVRFSHLVQTSAPAHAGAFINVDRDRDGSEGFLFIPAERIYRLHFAGLEDGKILYSLGDRRDQDPGYVLDEPAMAGGASAATFGARRRPGRPDAIELTLPALALAAGEALAASPLLRTPRGLERLTLPRPGAVRRLVLADLSDGPVGTARRLSVLFKVPAEQIARLQLYAVSQTGRRPIAEFDVSGD
jgi:hypothetical protein